MLHAAHQMLFGGSFEEGKMGGACGTYRGRKIYI
jgi:hypothetical protein